MDISLFVTYLFGILFWILVFTEMALATYIFCYFNVEYDKDVIRDGVTVTNQSIWITGLLSMGAPVLQAGVWIHDSNALGWTLVLLVIAFWVYIILTNVIDSKRG